MKKYADYSYIELLRDTKCLETCKTDQKVSVRGLLGLHNTSGAVSQFRPRLQAIVGNKGGYIE